MDFDSTLNKINSVIASVKESGLKEKNSSEEKNSK